jgi:phosphoglycerate dehydrogenase-like enzyme
MDTATKRRKVLITDKEYAAATRDVAPRFEQLELVCADESHSAQALAGGDVDALLTITATVDRALLEALPNLKAVLKMGRNYANVEAAAVRERAVAFASVVRKGPNCVAELALTLIMALSKDLLISHESVVTGAYRLRGLEPAVSSQTKIAFHWMHNTRVHEVQGKILGLVGMGEISAELARRAHVMGMRTLYYKRKPMSAELEELFAAEYRDLPALLSESDYVCLAVPHTAETEKMIGKAELALMKPTSYLVNICRGGVVDEDALIETLEQRKIAGAGLDVFRLEPLPDDSPLCELDNVILAPHIGGGTGTTRQNELTEGLEELIRILSGQEPRVNLNAAR